MHELSIATEIVSVVTAQLDGHDDWKIKRVNLRIGTHAGVETDTLTFCFPLATQDTPIAGAELEIEISPLAILCAACGKRSITDTLQCPNCGPGKFKIVGGRELDIVSIDLETMED